MGEATEAAPKVSVLLAVYNTNPDYLREAMDSILGQTFSDFELIVVNDGSSNEDVEKTVLGYTDTRIRYYRNERNLGITPTRNRLIELARGEYLAVMDHDDVSLPERLQKQVDYLDSHPDVGVVGSFFRSIGEKTSCVRPPVDDMAIRIFLARECAVHHPASMIRKSVLIEHGLRYEEEFSPAEDYALWCDLIPFTRFHNIPEVLFLYRVHSANTNRLQSEKMHRAAIAIQGLIVKRHYHLAYQFNELTRRVRRVRLFGRIPLLKIVSTGDMTHCYLFNRLLLYKAKTRVDSETWQ